MLMLAVLFGAPLVGLVWGVVAKRLVRGLVIGLGVGIGNDVLWTVYNAITDKLGLDTVKNLVVNVSLFVVLGVIIGLGAAWLSAKSGDKQA